jgi:Outer membrane efflux protein
VKVGAHCGRDSGAAGTGGKAQDTLKGGRKLAGGTLACTLLVLALGARAWGQTDVAQSDVVRQMIRVVLESNPTLASQQALVRESAQIPDVGGSVAITGLSLSGGTSFWDPTTNAFRITPAVTLGTSLSLADPARLLNIYNLRKEQQLALQGYQKTRDALIADVVSTATDLLSLASKQESLRKLEVYLQDYSDLLEKQVKAGAANPDLQKLWDLRERIMGIEVDIQDAKNKMGGTKLEAAMRLGGDAWQRLLDLFAQLVE